MTTIARRYDPTTYLGPVTVPNGYTGDEITLHLCMDPEGCHAVWNDRGMIGYYTIRHDCWPTSRERDALNGGA